MSTDPAISGLVGWAILNQSLDGRKIVGVAVVGLASIGADAVRNAADAVP